MICIKNCNASKRFSSILYRIIEQLLQNRIKVQILYENGIKSQKTLSNMSKLHISTIYRIISRIKTDGNVKQRLKSGGPRKLDSTDKKRISNLANSHPLILVLLKHR
jgi:transposase